MVLTYAPEVDELLAHLDHQARSSPVLRRTRRASRLMVIIAFAAVAAMIVRLPGSASDRLRAVGASGLAVLAVLALAPLLAGALRRSLWRQMLAGPRGASLRARRTLTLEPGGVRVKGPKGETFTPWDGIYEVTELPSVVLLQVGPMAAQVIPVRAFEGPAEQAAFVAEVRSHLP